MIKIEEGNFSAKGDSFKLTVEFEVLCRCFREMLVERLGEDEANAKFDELIANSKIAEEERLKLVKEKFSAGLDNLFKELAKPDIKMDFREMPFSDNTFKIVVFDPPHLKQAGSESWLAKKYGVLPKDWKPYLKAGFDECMRVLEPDGILVFKWNEEQIKLNDVLKEFGKEPLLGDQRGKTRWILFMK